jgi:hypothetical protein
MARRRPAILRVVARILKAARATPTANDAVATRDRFSKGFTSPDSRAAAGTTQSLSDSS